MPAQQQSEETVAKWLRNSIRFDQPNLTIGSAFAALSEEVMRLPPGQWRLEALKKLLHARNAALKAAGGGRMPQPQPPPHPQQSQPHVPRPRPPQPGRR